jgi:hypothetical protein
MNKSNFEMNRFEGNCTTCGQKFMAENVQNLIDTVVLYRNHLTTEFGPNDYHDDKLVTLLESFGVTPVFSEDNEDLSVVGDLS